MVAAPLVGWCVGRCAESVNPKGRSFGPASLTDELEKKRFRTHLWGMVRSTLWARRHSSHL